MSVIMDSSHFHQPGQLHRAHTAGAHHSLHPVDHRGAIRKRTVPTVPRHRSVSTTRADRLQQLATEQSDPTPISSLPSPAGASQWLTPQPSPQPQHFAAGVSAEQLRRWTVPTPPRSDPGVHNVSLDSTDLHASTSYPSGEFHHFDTPTSSAEMSSLGFLLPTQYGATGMESDSSQYPVDQNFIPPVRVTHAATTSSSPAYAHTISSSPALYQNRSVPSSASRRPSEVSAATASSSSYSQSYRRPSNSYESVSSAEYALPSSATTPSVSNMSHSMPPAMLRSSSGSSSVQPYHQNASRSPHIYETALYGPSYTAAPSTSQMYASSNGLNFPPPFVGSSVNEVLAKPLGSDASIRILNQRPKPQCWEHGCNGRQFSTFSNLLRHQREKSGTAAKSYCPKCGAEFTRTTARNGHLAHDKCTKQRRPSEDD